MSDRDPLLRRGVPFRDLYKVPEPWPVRRWRGLWIYLGQGRGLRPWLADVATDLHRMWQRD